MSVCIHVGAASHEYIAPITMGLVLGRIDAETPSHEVVATIDDVQIQCHGERASAEVCASDFANTKNFGNEAFRVLAKYIGVFGQPQNNDQRPIAMTAPVISEGVADPGRGAAAGSAPAAETMAFLLPAAVTAATAPKPSDPRVRLRTVPPCHVAVSRFTWTCTMEVATTKAEELLATLETRGVAVTGPWRLARYNPPFTIPFLRTNEIHIPVDPATVHGSGESPK